MRHAHHEAMQDTEAPVLIDSSSSRTAEHTTKGLGAPAHPSRWARLWPTVRRWAVPALGLLVLAMLISHAHKVDWAGAWAALKRYPGTVLLEASILALASHALYGCFDLTGRHHTRHGLPVMRTWAIAVASYGFNLNLGSLVGGVALRARLYARDGLDETKVGQIIAMSLSTNWLGYGLVAGGLFASGMLDLPDSVPLSNGMLQVIGVGLMLLPVAYLGACLRWHGATWKVRGKSVHLPTPRLALVQLALSTGNWCLMGTLMYLLLGGSVPYAHVLGVLLAASVVGVCVPIPAGLGVLEAVYLALLSGQVPQGKLMGAVLAYRALYYLLPLAIALGLYAYLEKTADPNAGQAEGA